MDFSTSFIALRDRLCSRLDAAFQVRQNDTVCGRAAALHAWFDSDAEAKFMGVISLGGSVTHSHEHRLLYAVPQLTEQALADWWAFAHQCQRELVQADANHQFTLISLILVYETAEPRALRRLRRLSSEVNYRKPQFGWSSIRLCAADAASGKTTTNRMGVPLAELLR